MEPMKLDPTRIEAMMLAVREAEYSAHRDEHNAAVMQARARARALDAMAVDRIVRLGASAPYGMLYDVMAERPLGIGRLRTTASLGSGKRKRNGRVTCWTGDGVDECSRLADAGWTALAGVWMAEIRRDAKRVELR